MEVTPSPHTAVIAKKIQSSLQSKKTGGNVGHQAVTKSGNTTYRLNRQGKEIAKEVSTELFSANDIKEDLPMALQHLRAEIKANLKQLKQDTAKKLIEEGTDKRKIGVKAFHAEVKQHFHENLQVQEAYLDRRLLASIQQRARLEQAKKNLIPDNNEATLVNDEHTRRAAALSVALQKRVEIGKQNGLKKLQELGLQGQQLLEGVNALAHAGKKPAIVAFATVTMIGALALMPGSYNEPAPANANSIIATATREAPTQTPQPTSTSTKEAQPTQTQTPTVRPNTPTPIVSADNVQPHGPEKKAEEPPLIEQQKTIQERIFQFGDMPYAEVKEWLPKIRNTHDAVITESLFTNELARLPKEKRALIMEVLADAHADAVIEHYGDRRILLGLDPGHGGVDVGSSAKTQEGTMLYESDYVYALTGRIAEKIKEKSDNIIVVRLRSDNPPNETVDNPAENQQRRKATLMKLAEKLGIEDAVHMGVHLNGAANPAQKPSGTEVYYPNFAGMQNTQHQVSSMKLAQLLQRNIVGYLTEKAGYIPVDRGAIMDPDFKTPYLNLGAPRLENPFTLLPIPRGPKTKTFAFENTWEKHVSKPTA